MPGPRIRRVLAISAIAATALATLSTPAHAADTSRYVALGDSFTAGPLVPHQTGSPIGCFRSTANYPAQVAEQLGVDEFVDVSCSSATTEDMHAPQNTPIGTNPPQLDALTADTTMVSLGISGNDIGFAEIFLACGSSGAVEPWGQPCQDKYVTDGTDELRERITQARPKVDAVLAEINRRSPDAAVVVTGYPALLPAEDGCWPKVPIAKKDVPYLDGIEQELNGMLSQAAAEAGAAFAVDYSRGHDMCADRSDRWVEGIIPTKPAFPIHPNADGMAAMAATVVEGFGATATTGPAA